MSESSGLSSLGIRRQILAESDITGIRKKYQEQLTEANKAGFIEIGSALDSLTETKGWVVLQAYMMEHVMRKLLTEEDDGVTKGFIRLMQYVDQMVRLKNDIEAKENERQET